MEEKAKTQYCSLYPVIKDTNIVTEQKIMKKKGFLQEHNGIIAQDSS